MSVSTWDALGGAAGGGRQRQRRRNPTVHADPASAPDSAVVPANVKPQALAAHPAKGRQIGGLGLAVTTVVALHISAIALWQNVPVTPLPEARKQTQVELVKPPEPVKPKEPEKIEPPKPLPQKLAPPPKPVARPVVQPAPAPVPQRAEAAPVSTPAPAVADPTPAAVTIPAPPAPAPAPVVAAPVPETVTQAVGYAGYLHNPAPVYPANAQRMGLEGKVILRVRVLASGKAASVEVQASSGRKMLDEAAIAAVNGWLFSPSRRGQTPIDGWATVPIEFKLERS